MNWFGTKLGEEDTNKGTGGGGVGRYLNLKRPLDSSPVVSVGNQDVQKKRKLGFSDFEGW
jgi:peptidyl-prolyl cis-trans isomerase-like protein 2